VLASFGTGPPFSTIITNPLPTGSHVLTVANTDTTSKADSIDVYIALLGIGPPRVDGDHFSFDVVTAFPGKPAVIQSSTDLRTWSSISTNIPATNSFQFVERITSDQRYYRAIGPW